MCAGITYINLNVPDRYCIKSAKCAYLFTEAINKVATVTWLSVTSSALYSVDRYSLDFHKSSSALYELVVHPMVTQFHEVVTQPHEIGSPPKDMLDMLTVIFNHKRNVTATATSDPNFM